MRKSRTSLVVIVSFLTVLLASCVSYYDRKISNIETSLPKTYKSSEVCKALEDAALHYGWKVNEKTADSILVEIRHVTTTNYIGPKPMAQSKITCTNKGWSITYQTSKGMSYNESKQTINMSYNRWVKNINDYAYQTLTGTAFNSKPKK